MANKEDITKINDYSYSMSLENITIERKTGEEWFDNGIKYTASELYGFLTEKCFSS